MGSPSIQVMGSPSIQVMGSPSIQVMGSPSIQVMKYTHCSEGWRVTLYTGHGIYTLFWGLRGSPSIQVMRYTHCSEGRAVTLYTGHEIYTLFWGSCGHPLYRSWDIHIVLRVVRSPSIQVMRYTHCSEGWGVTLYTGHGVTLYTGHEIYTLFWGLRGHPLYRSWNIQLIDP